MKHYSCLILLLICLLLSSCATIEDMEATRSRIDSLELKSERLASETKTLRERTNALGKAEADEGVDVAGIKDALATLTGRVDMLQKDISEIKDGMDKFDKRIFIIEKYLGVDDQSAVKDATRDSDLKPLAVAEGDKEYNTAYKKFMDKKYVESRNQFEKFLFHYPHSDKAADAWFWIGESFFYEGNYEQAILRYEKIVKNYFAAEKLPYALIKQGLCFYKLGDKRTAILILQKVTQKYPRTDAAALAYKKIKEMEQR